MSLSKSDVLAVAKLARLEFTEEELIQFTEQLDRIVHFVEQLNQVNTDGVEPMAHPMDVESVLRDDIPVPGLTREEALQNAPNQDGEFFLVPPVLAK